ncbi:MULTISPECIES: hypothetical protein [unclassified Methylobacterium]|uniref:hypothetical protein n=1 Tax=unclassified Methylobacterium TaxID=2615210 RepID=UPI000702029E|nr:MULTISPECIES: hypothetical protein [unclassified Methylobacterium]KQO45569.1 hypothetical protein ASF24_10305 [Methylobacterium sp. Leaf86]KQO92692.1 hypothetical protein ASF32_21550 [Methylobacterium sp. Leaf91]
MSILSVLIALFSLAAAMLWFISSRVHVPIVFVDEGGFAGGTSDPNAPQKEDPTNVALRKQSKLSAWGAFSAAGAALLQTGQAIWAAVP